MINVELKTKIIRKYGTKLCVCGNVSIQESEALASLEYLFADGTVSVDKELEDAFDEIDSVYTRLKVIDPELGYITDRPMVKIGTAVLKKYPKGVQLEDCATVRLSKELSAEDIIAKLHISDCAVVVCTKEQEEAVSVIAEDVAMIGALGQEQEGGDDEKEGGIFGSFLNELKDTQVINAAEYKM